jgi:hypothetical protein
MVRAVIARCRWDDVAITEANAVEVAAAEWPFDFVHARLLLMNMRVAQKVTMVGQMLALQDWDRASLACCPAHPTWTLLLEAYSTAFSANGGDGASGRSLGRCCDRRPSTTGASAGLGSSADPLPH